MMRKWRQTALIVGFTAIVSGYLSVWLRGPGAGLSFLGIELGEWLKFLGLGPRRDIFYLPPILLALMLCLWTVTWPQRPSFDWRGWTVRGLALLISLLAFPAIEDIRGPVREQYVLRLLLVIVVLLVAFISAFWRPQGNWRKAPWVIMALLAFLGFVLPIQLFLEVQSFLSELIGTPIGAGIGLWLNAIGNAVVIVVALLQAFTRLGQGPAGD